MAGSGVRSKYNIAINGKGFMLKGAPQSPVYVKGTAATLISNQRYSNQFNINDPAFSEFTGAGWNYYAQSDWTGGFNRLKHKDDGSFKDGRGIDVLAEEGNVKLANAFTSALNISGSHSYGSHQIHDGVMLLGTIKAGAAKILKITSANVLSTLSAYAGISAVNSMSRFGDTTLVGLTRTSGTLKTLAQYRNGAISGFRSTNPIVRAVRGIGARAYISEYIASLSGDRISYATTLSAFTSAYNAGKNRKIPKIMDLNGTPYFFVEEARKVQMYRWDELAERAFPIYTFNDLTDWGVAPYLTYLIITGSSNGKKVAYAFNGARLIQIFFDQLNDSSWNFSKPFEFDTNLHTKGAMWDGDNWFPGLYGLYKGVQYTPFANFNNKAYAFAISGNLNIAYLDTAKYQISGHVIGSNYGDSLGAVDKLVNAVNVNTKPLATGQMLEVFRSVDEGANYQSIGTLKFATEGALTNKKLYFPSGFVTRKWLYKTVLVGPGTSTPTMQDISFEYRPTPDLKRQWSISVDAGDNVFLLNKQQEQRDGKALISEVWLEKDTKKTVVFEDIDAFSAKILSAMTSAATSARVASVRLMPPKGRIRVLKANVVEEMTYTSADGGSIKGISRGQRGTKARAYTSADSFDNFYHVIVTDVKEQVNNTDQQKTESIARITMLEV